MYYTNIIKSISARGLFTLLALIMSISLHAQNATVKGVIVDETDTPLIGATVQVKGTATGSITDFDCVISITLMEITQSKLIKVRLLHSHILDIRHRKLNSQANRRLT